MKDEPPKYNGIVTTLPQFDNSLPASQIIMVSKDQTFCLRVAFTWISLLKLSEGLIGKQITSQCWCWYLLVCAWKGMSWWLLFRGWQSGQVNFLNIVWMGTMWDMPGGRVQMHSYGFRYQRCLDPVDWRFSKGCSFSCLIMLFLWFLKEFGPLEFIWVNSTQSYQSPWLDNLNSHLCWGATGKHSRAYMD